MTDNEIIKAYGCCNLSHDECGGCDNCPCKIEGDCIVPSGFELEREVFNLLHRQKAEIERLTGARNTDPMDFCGVLCRYAEELINKAKAKAVKEFAERLKEKLHLNSAVMGSNCAIVNDADIDKLVKEMVGADNG